MHMGLIYELEASPPERPLRLLLPHRLMYVSCPSYI